jgi:hypothetical protein
MPGTLIRNFTMSKKDNMTKAELVAELDAKEQELEAANAAKEAAEKQANKILAETEHALKNGAANTAPKQAAAKPSPKQVPAPSPDGKWHFHSQFRRYRVPGATFFEHRFTTDDASVAGTLQKHSAFGREFWLTFIPEDKKAA